MKYLFIMLMLVGNLFSQIEYPYTDTLFNTQYIGDWETRFQYNLGDSIYGATFHPKNDPNSQDSVILFTVKEISRSDFGFYVTDRNHLDQFFGTYTQRVIPDSNGVYYIITNRDIYYSIGKWKDGIMIYANTIYPERLANMLFEGQPLSIIPRIHFTLMFNLKTHDVMGRRRY